MNWLLAWLALNAIILVWRLEVVGARSRRSDARADAARHAQQKDRAKAVSAW